MNNSELTDKARGVARTLTYNDDMPQAQAKHVLLELAHRLDTVNIRLHRKADGVLATTALGRSRFLTLRERLACWLLGGTSLRV